MTRRQLNLLYLSTFVSSIGTLCFTMAVVSYLREMGFSVFDTSLLVGFTRLTSLLSMFVSGRWIDSVSPKKYLIGTEIAATVATLVLLHLWGSVHESYFLFVGWASVRAAVIAIQSGSRSRIMKDLSGEDLATNSRTATWLNQVTHGSIAISALISFYAVQTFDFRWLILFDGITFVICGVIIWWLPIGSGRQELSVQKGWFESFSDLYRFAPEVAKADLALAAGNAGLTMFLVRLSGPRPELVTFYLFSYGLAVWIAGSLVHRGVLRSRHISIWMAMGVGYILVGISRDHSIATFASLFFVYTCYWLLFHRYSGQLQHQTASGRVGGVMMARNVQMLAVLVIGEFAVGAVSNTASIEIDIGIRLAIFIVFSVYLARSKVCSRA